MTQVHLFGGIPARHAACKHPHRLQHMSSLLQRDTLENALKQLWVLDALDIDGGITPLGRQMVSLPLEPSLARALIAATQLGCLFQTTTVAAMLSAESIFQGNRSGHACTNALSLHSSLLSCSLLSMFSRATGEVVHVPQSMPCQCIHHCCQPVCQAHLPESINRSGCAHAVILSCYP